MEINDQFPPKGSRKHQIGYLPDEDYLRRRKVKTNVSTTGRKRNYRKRALRAEDVYQEDPD